MTLRELAEGITERRLAKADTTIPAEVREQMIADCEERLEDCLNREILRKVAQLGKTGEFQRVLESRGNPAAYLAQVIPNHLHWMEETLQQVAREVEGTR